MKVFRLLLLPLVLIVVACSSPGNIEPPAELIKIENREFVKLLWSIDSGKGAVKKYIDMQPFIHGDKIYTIDTLGVLTRIDSSSGRADWKFDSGLASSSGLTGNASTLVATSRNGEVVLFDYDDKGPEQRWKQQINSEIRTKAVLQGAQVFIRSVDGKLSVMDASSGKIQWSVSRRVPALSLTGSSFPVVTEELVISGFDSGKLVAFNRQDGSTVWEHTVTSPRGRTEIERLVDLDGQFILRDSILYVSSFQGDLVALTLNSGQVLWSRKFSSFQAMDADDDALYLTDDHSHIWSIDRRTGSSFWKQDEMNARQLTAVKVADDKLIVADLEGYVHWLNKADGRILTRIQAAEPRYITRPQIIDSKVIVMDISGQVRAFTQDRNLYTPKDKSLDF